MLDKVTGTWKKQNPTALMWPFLKTPGPTKQMGEEVKAIDFFTLYFDEAVWDLLVTETNRYATQIRTPLSSARCRPWTDTTVSEMKAFFGILIIMGVVHLPRLEMYWQKQHSLIQVPEIPKIMPFVRFEQIWRFLHLCDSSQQIPAGQPGHDRLFKVRALLDLLTPSFKRNYQPHKEISVDEAMIPFKGRLAFIQYMKAKPVKWGIKVFVLADAHNGYTYRLQIYTGKQVDETASASLGLCSRVVLDLIDGMEDDGHTLFTDNYYTSPELYLHLYNSGVNACGTVRTNRRSFPTVELVVSMTIVVMDHYWPVVGSIGRMSTSYPHATLLFLLMALYQQHYVGMQARETHTHARPCLMTIPSTCVAWIGVISL